jgi:hypothetical protein
VLAGTFVKPSVFLPQGITTQIMVWAIINGLITLALMPFAPKTRQQDRHHRAVDPDRDLNRHRRLCRAVAGRSRLQDRFPVLDCGAQTDERKTVLIFLIYLVPFTAFFVIALHVLHRNFATMGAGRGSALYLTHVSALTLGFVPLSTIVAIQFVPLLGIAALFLPSPGGVPAPACPAR